MIAPSPLGRRAFAAALAILATCQTTVAKPPSIAGSSDPRVAVTAAVAEASRRFGIPSTWIWHIMRVESGGDVAAVSSAGAMGLMQIMPATYAELRERHGLGADPFAVRDNVLAGTAYLRELHDRYGADGMLAAYNAGPGRWEDHLKTGRPLPGETQRYLARLSPAIASSATLVSPPRLATPRPSPFTAPIFVRTVVALPTIGAATRPQTTDSAPSVDGAATRAAMQPTPNGSTASDMVVVRPNPPRSAAIFVASSSPGTSQ